MAVFVALVLIALAVAAGFQGDRFAAGVAGALARLGPLAEPVVFGASWLEIFAGGAVIALIVVGMVRSLRR